MLTTSKNSNLINDSREPFLLKPSGKDYLWGGNRLNEDFAKGLDMSPLAETWECSTHPDGPCYAASGKYAGETLSDILKVHPDYLGTHPRTEGELPILMKLIDARQDLSVQVHPDDEYAFVNENGQLGKTEMWYILDAVEGAELIYGLSHGVDKETFRQAMLDSCNAPAGDRTIVDKYFQKVPVHKGDLFYIEAGTIHAIGSGILLAEVQENSNLTYRLYDFNREDKNGNRRELHIDKALEVANLSGTEGARQPMRVLKYSPGCAREMLCRCKYFEVHRMLINTLETKKTVKYISDKTSFRTLLCTDGEGHIDWSDGYLDYKKGDCIFIPADSVRINIEGKAEFIDVRC